MAGHAFYPLTIGNRWDYERRDCMRMLNADGDAIEDLVWTSEVTRELVGTADISEREYVTERESGFEDSSFGHQHDRAWVVMTFLRQDRSGLYSPTPCPFRRLKNPRPAIWTARSPGEMPHSRP